MATDEAPRVDVLGVGVSAINIGQALDIIDTWVARREQHYVCVTGVHGVMESQRDERLRHIHNAAGLVTPDGMPLVWLSRLRGFQNVDRVYGPDLMLAACDRSIATGHSHFFYGGGDGVADRLADRLSARYPGLRVAGTYTPPFRNLTPDEDQDMVQRVNDAKPDIVWVGLSTPKQERWMYAHTGRLRASALIGVGAAFDFHSGLKRQAPHWMQRSGLEWMFRMVTEPRRRGPRYLVNNPAFVWRIVWDWAGMPMTRPPGAST